VTRWLPLWAEVGKYRERSIVVILDFPL